MSVARRGHSLALERVLQPQLTQRHLGLIHLLRRNPFSGGDLHSKRELQACGCGELREHLRVEVHPLLVRDGSIPHEARNVCGYGRLAIGFWRGASRTGATRYRRFNNIVLYRTDPAGLVCLRELALDEEDVVGDLDVLGGSELFQWNG